MDSKVFKNFSHSQRALWQQCHKKYYWQYVRGLQEPDADDTAASYSGQCVHPLIAALHIEPDASIGRTVAAALFERWAAGKELQVIQYPWCSLETLLRIVEEYLPIVEQDREEGWVYGGNEVKLYYQQLLQEDELQYLGKVDVLETRGDEKRVVEVKFSASSVVKDWGMDNQVVGYAVCAEVERVDVVEVRVEKATKNKKQRVSVMRVPVTVDADIAEAWKLEMLIDRGEVLRAWKSRVWSKNTGACWSFGRVCGFKPLCMAGALAEGRMMEDWPKRQNTQEENK